MTAMRRVGSRILSCVILAFVFSSVNVVANTDIFNESFQNSSLNLNWLSFPGFSQNPLTPILDPTTPEGDLWAGRQTNVTPETDFVKAALR